MNRFMKPRAVWRQIRVNGTAGVVALGEIVAARSVCNQPQVCELEHQQFYSTTVDIHPGLGAAAASFAPANNTAAEGRVHYLGSNREPVAAGTGFVVG